MTPALLADDPLLDFRCEPFAAEGVTRNVYIAGSGPATLVMTEMPGISPQMARFARWVRDAGMTVYLPSLFGRDGVTAGVDEAVCVFRQTCISAEFSVLATNGSTPIVNWLRALAHAAHADCGGPGIGAVGMCFTGNFALSLMLDAPNVAPSGS